jgi:2-hydroxychromene-2-carboxylate isomerase
MTKDIDVFFEFSSPYSYLAALQLPALAARYSRTLRWRPIELANVWEAQGVLEPYKAVRRVKVAYIWRELRVDRR